MDCNQTLRRVKKDEHLNKMFIHTYMCKKNARMEERLNKMFIHTYMCKKKCTHGGNDARTINTGNYPERIKTAS